MEHTQECLVYVVKEMEGRRERVSHLFHESILGIRGEENGWFDKVAHTG